MSETNENQQTAVDDTKSTQTNEADAAGATAQDQGDGLDKILKEFEDGKNQTQATSTSQTGTETKADTDKTKDVDLTVLSTLEQRINEMEAERTRSELEKVFDDFATGTQGDAVDAESFLNSMARRDPRIDEVYQARKTNPRAWEKVRATLKAEFVKRVGQKVDTQVTSSRDAVEAAVRSASTAAPKGELTEKDIRQMTKADFDEEQRKLGVVPV